MKEGWEYKKLGEICDFRSGFAFKSNKFTKIGEPIIRISDIQNEEIDDSNLVYFDPKSYTEDLSKYLIYPDDILIAMSGGTTGKIGINTSNRTYYLNQRVGVFRENKKYLNHRYLFYFLHTKSEESLKIAAGAAQPNLSTAQIKSFLIPVPSLSEQQSIVDYLDSAFAKIDAMKANAEKALNEAKALFQASLKEMLEPKEGWVTSTLKDECYKITDGTHQTPKYYPSGYIFLSSKNVTSRKIDWEDVKFIDESQHQLMYKRVAPQVGDILLAKNGTTGVAAMVDRDVVFDIYVSLALLRSRGNVTPEYLLAFVNSPIAKEQFDKRLIGMGVPNLHLGEINQVVITYPQDKVEQIRMTQRIEELDCLIIRLQENYDKISQECDALKQAVLRQVFE